MSETPAVKPAIAFDTETHPFGMGNLAPKLVCMSVFAGEEDSLQVCSTAEPQLQRNIDLLFATPEYNKVAHHTAFDLAVLAAHRPALLPAIFQGLADGLFEDTIIREKLLHLTVHGDLKFMTVNGANGQRSVTRLEYDLASMTKRYTGIDRSAEKKANDSWRTHYKELEGIPVAEWPPEARSYVCNDSIDCYNVRQMQEIERGNIIARFGIDPFKTQDFRVAVDFSLYLMGAWGLAVDPVAKARIETMLTLELDPSKMALLVETGILLPGVPERIRKFKNGAQQLIKAIPAKVKKAPLIAYMESFAKINDVPLSFTEPSDKHPKGQVSTEIDWFELHWMKDPVLGEYYKRQKLQKLVTTEMPHMNQADGTTAPMVHISYDCLKRTGRTSCRLSDKYPTIQAQNIDPRVRECFVPRPGFLLFSIDYSGMELGTLAQKCYDLFKASVLRDKINAGIDCHAYLGAQLAYNLDTDFRASCDAAGATTPDMIYHAFAACKEHPDAKVQKIFKHYRKFAKPTGFGYPGGLGAKTFITFAKGTYDVDVDQKTAELLKDIWLQTYPEMPQYLKWITTCCHDLIDSDRFAYSTPMGMYRAGVDYCGACNGAGLQSPSAEGALLAGFNIIRACFDHTLGSMLCDDDKGPTTRPIAFIHDEYLGEVRDDGYAPERVTEMAEIMVKAMRVITPDVVVKAQPTLMRRWSKSAEPVFGKDGRLTVWEPKKKE